ncbi:major capsid protein [Streptomyces sp. NPDC005776]|uniref:major capsid protein n=1 Tax=Streptomyces sp. NPDC005776 TaxID=3154676 RepID=UPI0033D8AAB4
MPDQPTPFNPAEADDTALSTEYERIRTRGQELAAVPATEMSAEQTTELGELAAGLTAVQTERTAREQRATELAAHRDAFSALEPLSAPAAAAPEPVAVEPPAAAPEAVQAAAAPAAPAPVAVPSVAALATDTPAVAPIPPRTTPRDRLSIELSSDAASVLSRAAGDSATTAELTRASIRMFSEHGRAQGQSTKRSLGTFRRDRGADLTLDGRSGQRDADVIRHARDQSRLDGGSLLTSWQNSVRAAGESPSALTAAAGWCAPSENRYELCSLWDVDGIFDAPTTTAPRGGINYTNDFTWADIDAATSFTKLTEAQVEAGTAKNCFQLPCPEFTDRRLDVGVTCITGSFLQSVGYPEVVSTWTDGLLTKHEYEINADILAQVVTQAGAANVIPAQGAAAPGFGADTSVTNNLLQAVELAAIDERERNMMRFDAPLEVVLPHWVLGTMRADIARKNSWHTDPYALANATIMSWFAARAIRVQFVRGWQDAQSGLAGGPGDITAPITPILAYPATVQFLIYPAGAIVIARQDVITLTNVYDSTNLKLNLYTALFTEEGYAPIFPCGDVRLYTVQACPSGVSAAPAYTGCAVPAAAA